MKRIIIAATFSLAAISAASAACVGDIQPASCAPVPGTSWAAFPPVSVEAGELAEQRARNAAWARESYNRAITSGVRDGNLPVAYATQYWNGSVGGGSINQSPANPVGASIGGSDGGCE